MAYVRRRRTGNAEVRYDVRWRLEDGETRNRTFATRGAAEAKAKAKGKGKDKAKAKATAAKKKPKQGSNDA